MNLISCDNCGVVLDKDKLRFPAVIYDDIDDEMIKEKSAWNGSDFTAIVPCPVCKEPILEEPEK